jgi:hypothetical protein
MTCKVLKGWANCNQFLIIGEYVSIPNDLARQLIQETIVVESKAPEGVSVREISDNLVVVV